MTPADEGFGRAGIPLERDDHVRQVDPVDPVVHGAPASPVAEPTPAGAPALATDAPSHAAGGIRLDSIPEALAAIRRGEAVVVVDDEDRENEGDLIFAGQKATPELTAFMIRHTSGYICVSLLGADLDRLGLPPMTAVNEDRKQTAYAVSVDARDVESTGISAADRAHTIKVLADSATEAYDLTRPGHVMPLRAVPGGVLRRPGHTEAAVDLAHLAGLSPSGALCELMNEDGTMMRAPQCRAFADEHGLRMISIADLIRYRRGHESQVQRVATTTLPTAFGDFTAIGYRSSLDDVEHVALVVGEIATAPTSWSGCTPSASPVTRSARCAATAVPSCRPRCWRCRRPGVAWCSTCVAMRAAESASCRSWRRMRCRTPVATRWMPTWTSGCRLTLATTARARRSWPTSVFARCAC